MKKLMFMLVGLLSATQAMADPMYRPFASCISPNHNTSIEIMQNMDSKDTDHGFSFSVVRMVAGNKISLANQNAVLDPIQRKDILELFVSYQNKPAYEFSLVISNQSTTSMFGEYRGIYTDLLGSSVVYCSHHVTFGN